MILLWLIFFSTIIVKIDSSPWFYVQNPNRWNI